MDSLTIEEQDCTVSICVVHVGRDHFDLERLLLFDADVVSGLSHVIAFEKNAPISAFFRLLALLILEAAIRLRVYYIGPIADNFDLKELCQDRFS